MLTLWRKRPTLSPGVAILPAYGTEGPLLLVLQLHSRISLKLGIWILVMGGGHLENPVTLEDPKVFSVGFPGGVHTN